jgi:hypothetical protein
MKTKLMVVVVTMLFALAMVAQTATQSVPSAPATGDKASGCACCTGDKCPMGKDGKMADGSSCCGEGCGKDGKCDIAAHKDHAMPNGKSCCGEGCCKDAKGDMAAHKAGKGGCCGDKCPMKGAKSASVSCCTEGATCCHAGADCCGKVPPRAALVEGDCCKSAAEASSCCKTGAACCKNGNLPCCDANRQAA